MILKTKNEILNWLEKNDWEYKNNIKDNVYELIDVHEQNNQSLLTAMIQKDNLPFDYFENLKLEGHQYILNVEGPINISGKNLTIIPIQFYQVNGDFECDENKLSSLKGSPQIVEGDFMCNDNQLTSLEHSPREIHGIFNCSDNQLNSLQGCPQSIASHFSCSHNQLTSLEHAPQSISGDFYCSHNYIRTLEYFPEKVDGLIFLENNQELLKYRNQSHDFQIQNMSDNYFCHQRYFSFWQHFYLQEKIEKENKKMMDDLILDELKENNHSIQPRFIKL